MNIIKMISNKRFAVISLLLTAIALVLLFFGYKIATANSKDESIDIEIPLEYCVNNIDWESQVDNFIKLKKDYGCNLNQPVSLAECECDALGSFLNLDATLNDGSVNVGLPVQEYCQWECYPMSEDCYTQYDENGPNQFQLLVHTSAGDAIGRADCHSPGLVHPGAYDIQGKRSERCVPGDSRGWCYSYYQGIEDGYYVWRVTNNLTKTSTNYQIWEGYFKAPAYGDCIVEKASTCSWSETNNNYCHGGSGSDCVHYDIFTDAGCTQNTGKYINLDQSDGVFSKGVSPKLQCGTYYIQESKTYHGLNYSWNSDIAKVEIQAEQTVNVVFGKTNNQRTYDAPIFENELISIAKSDFDTHEPGLTLGSSESFEDAVYEFDYYQDYFPNDVDIESIFPRCIRQWFMKTDKYGITGITNKYKSNKLYGDDYFFDEYGNVVCPLGTYLVKEINAPVGYLLSDIIYSIELKPDDNNPNIINTVIRDTKNHTVLEQVIDENSGDRSVQLFEQAIRGDYKFIKTNDDMRELSGIPFKITSQSTGEWHIFVTDANGCIDTSVYNNSRNSNVNVNDVLYDPDSNQILDESKLDPNCGYWFSLDKKTGLVSSPRDDCGCFPFDTYTIEELEISKNSIYYPFGVRTFTISKDNYYIDGGTWINSSEEIFMLSEAFTNSQDKYTKDHYLPYNSCVLAGDRIYYKGLIDRRTYSLKAWLIDKDNENIINFLCDDDSPDVTSNSQKIDMSIDDSDVEEKKYGEVTVSKEYLIKKFIADSNMPYVDIAADIDTTKLSGKNLVWLCELYDSELNNLIKEHKNIDDNNETLYVATAPENPPIVPLIAAPKTIDDNIKFIAALSAAVIMILFFILWKKYLGTLIFNIKYPGISKSTFLVFRKLFVIQRN